VAHERGEQIYLVEHFSDLPADQVQGVCAHLAAQVHGFTVVTGNAYRGDVRICSDSSGFELYAKRRDAEARAFCQDVVSPRTQGRKTEVVLRATPPLGAPVYVVLSGPRALTTLFARRFPPPKQFVRRPLGERACLSRGSDVTTAVYSTSKSVGASFCHMLLGRK
jgi:hypothetical protein